MPETVPFRLRVLRNLTALLKEISVSNGYKTDLAGRVHRGRSAFGQSDAVPFISILEPPVPPESAPSPVGSGRATYEWDLLIQGFVEDDDSVTHPTDKAHFLLADVKQALAKERQKGIGPDPELLGFKDGAVDDIIIGPGVVRPVDEISDVAYFWLRIVIKIVEDNAEPYV